MPFILAVALCGCGGDSAQGKESITIGSKNYTENIIMAHMMAEVIEAETDLTVIRKVNLGGSSVAWTALLNDEIQLFPDYTGTVVANYYQSDTGTSQETLDKTRELVRGDKLEALGAFGFNNTYTLAVTQETAAKYGLETFSDLAGVADELVLGCEFEFRDRPDGYPGLQATYHMNFKDVKGMDHGIMYRSLADGAVDVVDAYSTDGQISVYKLKILEDDKAFFPPYDCLPIARQDVLERHPEIETALSALTGRIDERTMQALNAKVDEDGMKAETVAHDFLYPGQ